MTAKEDNEFNKEVKELESFFSVCYFFDIPDWIPNVTRSFHASKIQSGRTRQRRWSASAAQSPTTTLLIFSQRSCGQSSSRKLRGAIRATRTVHSIQSKSLKWRNTSKQFMLVAGSPRPLLPRPMSPVPISPMWVAAFLILPLY